MSEYVGKAGRDFSQFDGMSTEALNEILRRDCETEANSEMDVILYVMEIISKREKENPECFDVLKKWEFFKEEYCPWEQEIVSATDA